MFLAWPATTPVFRPVIPLLCGERRGLVYGWRTGIFSSCPLGAHARVIGPCVHAGVGVDIPAVRNPLVRRLLSFRPSVLLFQLPSSPPPLLPSFRPPSPIILYVLLHGRCPRSFFDLLGNRWTERPGPRSCLLRCGSPTSPSWWPALSSLTTRTSSAAAGR